MATAQGSNTDQGPAHASSTRSSADIFGRQSVSMAVAGKFMPASAVTGGTLTVEVLAGPTAPLATSLESRENAKPPCRVDCCTLVQYHGRHVEWLYCYRFGCRIGPRCCWCAGRPATSIRGNPPLRARARLVADWAALGHYGDLHEIVAGLRKTAAWSRTAGVKLVSVGVDTWGVDWVLIDKAGELVGLPHAYRDPRNGPATSKSSPNCARIDLSDDRHPVHGA